MIDFAGKSFIKCGGFQNSKRLDRFCTFTRNCAPSMAKPRARKLQWDSGSDNAGSESALLPSESDVYDSFLQGRCYPGCNSLPRLMARQKLQLSNYLSMENTLHATKFGKIGLTNSQTHLKRNRIIPKRGHKCRTKISYSIHCSSQSSPSCRTKGSRWKHSNNNAAYNTGHHRSLSEKYRPCVFEDMVGQTLISQGLRNAIHRGKIVPAYLFQGPRGTGKTSAARIFAAALNCLGKDRTSKASTLPCRSCKHCKCLLSGEPSNVKIVDASSRIDDLKSLSRFVTMSPHRSRYKVLIIDECHMLSKEAWSLFLSISDNPPTRVVFILITTDTEKVPRMVVSKCHKLSFMKIKDADIFSRLQRLSDMESIDVEANALQLIASRADGSLFDAETTLDQLANLGQRITSGTVREMEGLVADEPLVELLEGAVQGDSVNTVRRIRQLMEGGIDPLALMSQLATLITDILAGHLPPHPSPSPSGTFTSQPLGKSELEKLRQALRILSEAEKQLRSCSNKATWLTAALLQFCPPDNVFHLDSHNLELVQSSPMGTSLTQSPNALLDTSEKETADIPCLHSNVKNLWDACEKQDHCIEDAGSHQEQGVCHTTSIERPESVNDATISQVDLHNKANLHYPAVDAILSSLAINHRNQSSQKQDVKSDNESCLQIVSETTVENHGSCNMKGIFDAPLSKDDVWKRVLDGSDVLADILSGQGKLVSLSVSEALAIVHLEFRFLKDKKRAENAKASISNAFQTALGCPVEVRLTLAPAPGSANDNFDGRNNAFYGGTLDGSQINRRKSRRAKAKKRQSRAFCLTDNYYSNRQLWQDLSNSHLGFEGSPRTNSHRVVRGGSSSDEGFSKWTGMYTLNPSTEARKNSSTRSLRVRTYGHVEQRVKEDAYDKYSQCALSGSHQGKLNVSERAGDTSHDLFYDLSMRVEKDSSNFSGHSFEYELEYEQTTMTPAFRTGFLCWKTAAKKERHTPKIWHQKARRKGAARCVPCFQC